MASTFVHEDKRKHKYSTRAATYYIMRISDPADSLYREFRSVKTMCKNLDISESRVRSFFSTRKESCYIKSKTGILYLLKAPVKDIAISARISEEDIDSGAPEYQTFTSGYQLVKRFRLSFETVVARKHMQPFGVECKKTVYDEFKRKYYLTFYK